MLFFACESQENAGGLLKCVAHALRKKWILWIASSRMSNAKKLSINVAWVSCSTVRGVTSDIGVTLTKKKKKQFCKNQRKDTKKCWANLMSAFVITEMWESDFCVAQGNKFSKFAKKNFFWRKIKRKYVTNGIA